MVLVPIALILFLAKRLQWEIIPIDRHSIQSHFRFGPFYLHKQQFSCARICRIDIEQDDKRYFNLYLLVDDTKIKIDRAATQSEIKLLKDGAASKLQWR
jgi:hypothetical protein